MVRTKGQPRYRCQSSSTPSRLAQGPSSPQCPVKADMEPVLGETAAAGRSDTGGSIYRSRGELPR